MNRFNRRLTFVSLFFSALLVCAVTGAAAPPNVVVIFIDDLGYGDIGPFGATKQTTPNLDRMAAEGMKLTSFYAAPVCSVSRAQLMTGCYGARISVPGVFGPGSKVGLNPGEHTIAERLKELGYATQCVGKWHLGDQPEFLPTRQGFDHYFGIPYSNDMQRTATATGQKVVPLVRDEAVEELLSDEQQSRIVERYTEVATQFIRDNKDKPFFLYFPHTAVHTPIWPGEAFRGKSKNGRFGDWVQEVDWSVGRVLDTLKELSLDENTLVLFTSDNGPWLIKGEDGGSAAPLRGGKGSTWEGGVRVPTLARWPGKIPPNSVCDTVAGTIDVLPTLISLAGGKLPAEPTIDGRDISDLLMGRSKEAQREAHYYFSGLNLQAVRQGPWKLAISTQNETMGRQPAEDAKVNPRLYNLDQEIGEVTNVAKQHPEIVGKLTALAEKMAAEVGGANPTARREAGLAAEAKTLYPSTGGKKEGKKTDRPKGATKNKGILSAPVKLDQLKVGDAVPSASAPQVNGVPFTVKCTITSAPKDGVILAHGGSAVGYALHLRSGNLIFTIHNGRNQEVETTLPEGAGPHKIAASLTQMGELVLVVDDKSPVTSTGAGLLQRQPQEDFCLGHDNQRPVTTYSANKAGDMTISDLQFTTP